jgi:transposase
MAWHRSNETSKRLDELPGVGPALATALVASVADPKAFRSGRNFSAWIGLVPQQHPSGGKDKLGSISKQGDRYLRSLFTAGALAVIRYAKMYAKEGEEPDTCFVAAIDVAETREPYAIWGGVRAGSDFFRREIWTWPR